jgi:hypothetical protein
MSIEHANVLAVSNLDTSLLFTYSVPLPQLRQSPGPPNKQPISHARRASLPSLSNILRDPVTKLFQTPLPYSVLAYSPSLSIATSISPNPAGREPKPTNPLANHRTPGTQPTKMTRRGRSIDP